MATFDDINKVRRWDFEVYDLDDDRLLSIIHYERDLKSEKASIEYKIDPDTEMNKLGPWLFWAIPRVPDLSHLLVDFLHDRVNPINRMGLIEHFEQKGIDPYDWIARMRINQGRSTADNLKVLVVDIDG